MVRNIEIDLKKKEIKLPKLRHNVIEIGNKLVKENDIIVSENLNVSGISKNPKLAKSLLDATFSKLLEYIKWKWACLGKYYYQVDPYYASSQICNHCGNKSEITKELRIRKWECPSCGSLLDRDINASINISMRGKNPLQRSNEIKIKKSK